MSASDSERPMRVGGGMQGGAVALTDEQSAVYEKLEKFLRCGAARTCAVFGLAGTGKTTLMKRLAMEHAHASLCTLTGKAASVLRRKTGLEAMTLHSFFYKLEEIRRDKRTGRRELIWSPALRAGELEDQIVLIDECMMVGKAIMRDILATGARVIACGDPGQLWPVKQEPYFMHGDHELTEIHRQALDSPIIRQAHRVRQGLPYEADGEAFVVLHNEEARDTAYTQPEVLLCHTHEQRVFLNDKVRRLRGVALAHPQAGEPVMCMKNVGRLGIYNGAIYTLLEPFRPGSTSILIDADGRELEIHGVRFEAIPSRLPEDEVTTEFNYGYACTVHKAAGSEWTNVALFDQYRRRQDPELRRWLYTGITRAADYLTIVL